MMRMRAAGCALLALSSCLAVAHAQPTEFPVPEVLVLETFDDPPAGRWTGVVKPKETTYGDRIGRWSCACLNGERETRLTVVPSVWSQYEVLEFWVRLYHGGERLLRVRAFTGDDGFRAQRGFESELELAGEEWQRVRLPLADFEPMGEADWADVECLQLSTEEEGIVELDTIQLLLETPAGRDPPRDVVSGFEEAELADWIGLVPEAEHVTQGELAGRWEGLDQLNGIATAFEMDWTPYDLLEFDCHSAAATGDRFILCIASHKEQGLGFHYWGCMFRVDWEGWRHLAIPFRRFYRMRRPVGWHHVTGLQTFPTGWGIDPEPSPETVLTFDDMRLTTTEPRAVPAGMVEDFEDGPWAWWWMDEGSVPAKMGEHCGELVIHEGWRSIWCTAPQTLDWSPYSRLTMWLYAEHMEGETLTIMASGGGKVFQGSIPLDGSGWREASVPLEPHPGEVHRMSFHIKGLRGDDEGKANRQLHPQARVCLDEIRLR